jgi:hypothetical protein
VEKSQNVTKGSNQLEAADSRPLPTDGLAFVVELSYSDTALII